MSGAATDDLAGLRAAVEGLSTEVAQLRDLFVRRLMDDKLRAGLFDTLQEELRSSREILTARAQDGLVKEMLLVVDRLLTAGNSQYQDLQELALSGADEILESLWRRGIEQVPAAGPLDPRVHEVVATIVSERASEVGTIAVVNRHGYLCGERLLRPAQVTVVIAADTGEIGDN
ncbi:nucleotide exchange factor GrpE (plasmid) [Rhodococcus pseudokoreensis]|uniref:Protein GrpE n=1 Tax=Rhodococcus pseudokoreensis TaxID=2811421 RepID=A0A974VZE3_9NOCA|nr:nucleotide exchange factor GrpE [Rhodococcus pseudokoreensis]QSE87877.1 nucleotide exchange factor GrpE [Rhodococcus pseudokoreensis]